MEKKIYLTCLSGKDIHDHFHVETHPLMMANEALHPQLEVNELKEEDGFLMFYNHEGNISFDATNCKVPVYLNNQPLATGELQKDDMLRIGNAIWHAWAPPDDINKAHLTASFSGLLGLENLKDFQLKDIFSKVFTKHTVAEMEEQLITGTAQHVPYLNHVEIGWGRPWLFARLLAASALLAFVLYAGFLMFGNTNLVPGLIFIGSFAVPVSTLIFFMEMNVSRNISVFILMGLLFVGGIASIFVALIFYDKFSFFETFLGASAAGIIEETAKILIVIMLVGKSTKYPWILNGLLLGAAVGTGFGAFESAGYAFNIILSDGMKAGVDNIIQRGLLAPFMHIVWTANVAAALWIVKKDKPFRWEMLKESAFLKILVAMVVAHMLWNAPFSIMPLIFGIDLKHVILGILEWMICFRLIQMGLKQLNEARKQTLQIAESETKIFEN